MKRLLVSHFLCVFAVVLFMLPGYTRAQVSAPAHVLFRTELIRLAEARYHIGPFKIFPTVALRLGYDNNVFRQENPDDIIGDNAARISVPVQVYLPVRDFLILSVTGRPEYVYYSKMKDWRGWNRTLSSEARLLMLHRFVISGSYTENRSRRRVTVEAGAPIYENIKGFAGSIYYEPGGRLSVGLSGRDFKLGFDDTRAAAKLDRREKSTQLTLNYSLAQGTTFLISGGYSKYKFQGTSELSRDGERYFVSSGINFPLLGRIIGTLSLGYSNFVPKNKIWPNFSGVVGNTSLSWMINRFRFRLRYFRNMTFSLANSAYFVGEGAGFGSSYLLTSFIQVGYDFDYGSADYPAPNVQNPDDPTVFETSRKDIYRTHSGSLVFRIIRNIGIGMNLDRWERSSSIPGWSRNSVAFYVYLTTSFNL